MKEGSAMRKGWASALTPRHLIEHRPTGGIGQGLENPSELLVKLGAGDG